MTEYRAIVSITFDDEDLAELAEAVGADPERMDAHDSIHGALDNLELGTGWVEQLFEDGVPAIERLTTGINVEISPHEPAA